MRRSGWGGTWPKVAVVGLRATWQVGYTGVVTALMPKAREEEASRPCLLYTSDAADEDSPV